MNKQITAIISGDETVTLAFVEPFDRTGLLCQTYFYTFELLTFHFLSGLYWVRPPTSGLPGNTCPEPYLINQAVKAH